MRLPKLYALVHQHEYGVSVKLFLFSPTKKLPMLTEAELVKHLKIDFDPDKGETLDICEADDMIDLDAAMARAESPIEQQKHEYVVHGGVRCVVCGSGDIEGTSFDTDAGLARRRVACHACRAEWTDIYGLVDVEVSKPEADVRWSRRCQLWKAAGCRL